jgi:hypothetical protein
MTLSMKGVSREASADQPPIEDVITPILTSLRHSLAGGGQTKAHTIPKRGVLAYHLSRP